MNRCSTWNRSVSVLSLWLQPFKVMPFFPELCMKKGNGDRQYAITNSSIKIPVFLLVDDVVLNLQMDGVVLNLQLGNSKVPIWTAYFDIRMVLNNLWDIKQKLFTFKDSLNTGIHSSPSKINMQNSVIQALLTRRCIHLIKECVIFSFTLRIIVLFGQRDRKQHSVWCSETAWRNNQCRLAPLFCNNQVSGSKSSLTYNERTCDM